MPNYTPNYNLKKPLPNENYNIQDFNDNADIIDQKLKEVEDSVENIEVPVTSVNGKTGDVELTAEDIGAETPAGAQEKANTALTVAKGYTDQEVGGIASELDSHKNDYVKHITSEERNAWSNKADGNIREDSSKTLKAEVVSSSNSETPEQGRIVFDVSQGKFLGGNGLEWV